MSAYPRAFSARAWLEPPSVAHHPRCAREDGTWYRCDCCGCVFDSLEGVRHGVNLCVSCGTFSKRVTECTCDRIWSE